MLAELVDHVVGVDPDRDWITLAVLDARSAGVVAEARFPVTKDGYDEAIAFVDGHSVGSERAWIIEGSAGYGRGSRGDPSRWTSAASTTRSPRPSAYRARTSP